MNTRACTIVHGDKPVSPSGEGPSRGCRPAVPPGDEEEAPADETVPPEPRAGEAAAEEGPGEEVGPGEEAGPGAISA